MGNEEKEKEPVEIVNKMSRTITEITKNLHFRIHVKLLKEKEGRPENFHQIFTIAGNSYMKLDFQSFFTLEMKSTEWDKSKSILIDQRNIYRLVEGLKESLDKIHNGKVFAMDKQGRVVTYMDEIKANTVMIDNLGLNQRIVIKPAVIYDENELSYEGVIFYINNTNNWVELPIQAFESLVYSIKESNLFLYSQAMLNYYIATQSKLEVNQISIEPRPTKKKKSVFDKDEEKPEAIETTVVKKQSNEEFFGLDSK